VLKGTTEEALKRFAKLIEWPPHLKAKYADPAQEAAVALAEYFASTKGSGGIADFLAQCSEAEVPQWLRTACVDIKSASVSGETSTSASTSAPPKPS
ncbi:MAG: ATP-dependent endonuclease, partial [Micropepsaceae bacterium]